MEGKAINCLFLKKCWQLLLKFIFFFVTFRKTSIFKGDFAHLHLVKFF